MPKQLPHHSFQQRNAIVNEKEADGSVVTGREGFEVDCHKDREVLGGVVKLDGPEKHQNGEICGILRAADDDGP